MTGLGLAVAGLTHAYGSGDDVVHALQDVSFTLPAGAAAAVMGPSGSGKSTLAMILAGLQRPTSGVVRVGEVELTALSETGLLDLRARHLAVVVQRPDRNLLGHATALDNLRFAQRGPRRLRRGGLPDPARLLDGIGLGHVAGRRADRLSGGERQRLALAAGLATGPDVLISDEPTSQLDEAHVDEVVDLLVQAAGSGVTVVAVTHDDRVAERLGTVLRLDAGRLQP